MTYAEFTKALNVSDVAVQEKTGLSRYHLCRVRKGTRPLTQGAAVRIWDGFRVKLDPIADVSDADLRVLAKHDARAA